MTGSPGDRIDLVVVGAGPAGLVTARRVADGGHRVVVVESAGHDRANPGDVLLTPEAVADLRGDGLDTLLSGAHPIERVRTSTTSASVSVPWPSPDGVQPTACVVPRRVLDRELAAAAEAAGVEIRYLHEATEPIVERGFVRGAHVLDNEHGAPIDLYADHLVVADGANSRFGRTLGSSRDVRVPYAVAHRATCPTPIHDATELEIVVGLLDHAGTPITGYGWMVPTGRGHADVGVLLLSTSPSFHVLNPAHVLEQFVTEHGGRWHLGDGPAGTTTGGRIPLGRSVGPAAGPTWLLVGDAVAAADPWSGLGLGPALSTGAIAGEVISEAIRTGSATTLQRYPGLLADRFEPRYRVGKLADVALGRPALAVPTAAAVARRPAVAEAALRLATGALRPDRIGPAEAVLRLGRAASALLPRF